MDPPTEVEFRGTVYRRYPDADQRAHRVYYQPIRGPGLEGREPLHRAVWKDANGRPIPVGMHVHHEDENPFNNDPSNLVLLTPKEHAARHPQAFRESEEWADHLAAIRPLAAEWHRSEEGRAWHREHGRETWRDRQTVDRQCEACGETFAAMFEHTRFCSTRCSRRVADGEHRYEHEEPCSACGALFWQSNYRPKPTACSRACAWELRRRRAAVGCEE